MKKIKNKERRNRLNRERYRKYSKAYVWHITPEDKERLLFYDIHLDDEYPLVVREEVWKAVSGIPSLDFVGKMNYKTNAVRIRKRLRERLDNDTRDNMKNISIPSVKLIAAYTLKTTLHFIANNPPFGFKLHKDSMRYVNESGDVITWNRRYLKPSVGTRGYLEYKLSLNTCDKRRNINCRQHRMVAETFIPNPHNKRDVNHKDGNKRNNHKDNLEWVTQLENTQHAIETNLYTHSNFLKEKDKIYICEHYTKVITKLIKELYNEYGNIDNLTFSKLGELTYSTYGRCAKLKTCTLAIRSTLEYKRDVAQLDINRQLKAAHLKIMSYLCNKFNANYTTISGVIKKRCKKVKYIKLVQPNK